MIITYHGLECFKIQCGNTVIATNPPSKESQAVTKAPKFGADIVVQSINHPDFNGGEKMSLGDKDPFVVRGPGEYEIKDIIIRGFATDSFYKDAQHINTLYSFSFEGMHLVFLGPLHSKDLPKEVIESLESIDILFVPIGGNGVLEASDAYKLAVKLESRVIIPMHFEGEKDKALSTFLQDGGEEKKKQEDKLVIKRRELDGMEGETVVLRAQ